MLAENRNSCAFSEVLLSLELCQSVTWEVHCFSENSKSYVILEVFLVGFELLRSCCLRRRCVLWESCSFMCFLRWNAAAMRADTMFGPGLEPPWMIHHYCALLQILRRPGEAGFTDSLVAHLDNWDAHFGEWRIMVVYEWGILCTISRINLVWTSEKILFAAPWDCVAHSPTRIFTFDVTQDLGYWRSTCQSHRYRRFGAKGE